MALNSPLLEHFKDLPDPRMVNKCDHLLIDIVMIAICATIANADSWEDIAAFGEGKRAWLGQWLALPNGIPSPDTFQRVFAHVDAAAFHQRFQAWVEDVFRLTEGQVIGVDGKTGRGTCDAQGQSTLHLVSAWATANHITLGQVQVGEKANEIVAIPLLLDLLMLKGCIVTLDAIGCQKTIVKQIREQEADYVVTVKGNQPKLQQHLLEAFAAADAQGWVMASPAYCETLDKRHGRIEQRQCWVLAETQAQASGWQDCQTLVRIRRVIYRSGAEPSDETHYYITSLPPQASLILGAVRAHWGIENGCHWVLDAVFREDASRTRLHNADENLALLRKIALNLIRQHPAKGSLKGKRYRAALNEDFLLEIMQSSFYLMR
ncbi:MAG TPA: ISAs1 family transposase [Aggregatilineaceae bacterium]|nr:ISAs1 family transposase [Aggregatilineaceae bacterium]